MQAMGVRERAAGLLPEKLRPWRRLARSTPTCERLTATTRHGQALALWRVRPVGTSRGAVLLLHGLSANRFAFHWPGRSIADYLSAAGFDCYVGELRGAGESVSNSPTWNFHDYLEQDVPAFLERIRDATGRPRVHFVGHSMGGILAMCHGIVTGGGELASATALGSALDFSLGTSGFGPLLHIRPLLERMNAVPWGRAMAVLSPLLARVGDPLAGFNFHPENAEPALVRAVYSNTFTTIPAALLGSLSSGLEPGGLSEVLIGDPTRLRQILINLVGNAIKFTIEGEVGLRVQCLPSKEGFIPIRFTVSDTGIGISKEKHQQIFDAFSQADSSTTREFGGTGLGLSISARLIQLMKGEVGLESAPGKEKGIRSRDGGARGAGANQGPADDQVRRE